MLRTIYWAIMNRRPATCDAGLGLLGAVQTPEASLLSYGLVSIARLSCDRRGFNKLS